MSKTREEALSTIVTIAQAHDLSADEIAARLAKDAPLQEQYKSGLIKAILSYIGGVFIFAGIIALVSMNWAYIGSAARVAVTLGAGVVALIIAAACAKDKNYEKAVTPLLLISVLLQPTGMFVFLREYIGGDNTSLGALIVFGIMAIQMALLLFVIKRASIVFFSIFFGFSSLAVLMDMIGITPEFAALGLGVSGLLLSYHFSRTPYRSFTPFTYFIAAMGVVYAAFFILEDWAGWDFALIGVAALLIYCAVLAQSRAFLVAAVLAMLGYLAYLTDEYFTDIIGWPFAVIVMGVMMLLISRYALKLGASLHRQP